MSAPAGASAWWYVTPLGDVHGPVPTPAMVSLFASGQVDGLTLVSGDAALPRTEWRSLAESPVLRDIVRQSVGVDSEDEGADAGDVSSGAAADSGDASNVGSASDVKVQTEAPIASHDGSGRDEDAEPSGAVGNGAGEASGHQPGTRPDLDLALSRERKRQSRKRAREAKRLRKHANKSVYVSGVPPDASERELALHFAKCGILLPSADTGRPRVKLYRDEAGRPKGDALVTYALQPSVENALAILDGVPLRDGGEPMSVQHASFEHKKGAEGEGERVDAGKRPREDVEDGEKKRRGFRSRDLVTEALSWAEEGQEVRKASSRIVILKNVFDAKGADYDMVREDMQEGCSACGDVEKITVFERNAEGAVAVKFTSLDACVKCIEVMNGRWYDGRMLSAEFYDGTTDYRYKETEEDKLERDRKWQEWLEQGRDHDAVDTAQPDAVR